MHCLILGITKSGKTYLAKSIAALSRGRGRRAVVLDILGDSWRSDYVAKNADELQSVLKSNLNCDVFVDESGVAIGRGKTAMKAQWLATQSRHWGHKLYFICQHYSFLDLSIRSQCDEHIIFRCSQKSADAIAEEIGVELAKSAPKLGQYEFFYFRPFKPPIRAKLAASGRVQVLQKYDA